jgi:hypothetical protein
MANPIQYSAADAGALVQIADAANGNLRQPPFLPVGWDLLTTITTTGLGSPQAILASGTLPSTGASVVVLAIGAPAASFLNYYTTANHTQATSIISGLLPVPPPPPPALPPPTIDIGFQALYNRLRSLIGQALTNFANSYATLLTCGIGGPGALAQLAAIDFRVGGTPTPGFLTAVGCYSFSTPPFVNTTAANTSVQTQLPVVYAGLFALTAQNDFFPSAPTLEMGYAPLGQQITINAPLPAYDSPWYERSTAYYTKVLAPNAALTRRVAPPATSDRDAAFAAGAYDPDLAYVLAQFCAAANEAFQHPSLSPSIPTGWTLLGLISNGSGQVMAVVYSKLTQVLVAFRGTSSFEETVQTFGNQSAQYVNFLPAPIIQPAGVVLQGAYNGYMALRQSFRQALSQIGGLATASLVLTGHDTGGWLALMAATDLMQGTGGTPTLPALGTPPQVYTFGTPALGNIPFTNFFTTKVTPSAYQVVRPADVVARLFIPGYFVIGSQQAVPGTTNYDDVTYHPVISYIQLLNPRNLAP